MDTEALAYYDENYELLFHYIQRKTDGGFEVFDVLSGKIVSNPSFYIKDDIKKCRFCGKVEPEVSFKKKAHAFPECMGNKLFVSKDNECDECNLFFSKYEMELNNFLTPLLVVNHVPGKHGKKDYQSNDKTSTFCNNADNSFKISEDIKCGKVTDDEKNKKFTYEFDVQKYTPLNIYKILVKMALAILPESEFIHYKLMRDYVLNDKVIGCELCLFSFFPGFNKFDLTVIGYKCKNKYNPSYQFAIMNGNIMLQIPVFSDDYIEANNAKNITMNTIAIPTPFDSMVLGEKKTSVIRLNDDNVKQGEKLTLEFKYGQKVPTDGKDDNC